MTSDDVNQAVGDTETIVIFQVSNGLLALTDAEAILGMTHTARAELEANRENDAQRTALVAYAKVLAALNTKDLKTRLLFLYGLHVWLFLAFLAAVLILLLYSRSLATFSFVTIPELRT